jgi:hypothetical protein
MISNNGGLPVVQLSFPELLEIGGEFAVNSNIVMLTHILAPKLTSVGWGFSISSNLKLSTVDFSSLITVGGALALMSNAQLQSADLRSVESIDGNLYLQTNHASFTCTDNNMSPVVAACKNKAKSPTCTFDSRNPSGCK